MDYFLTLLLLLVGIGYSVMQSIGKLRTKYPVFDFKTIWSTFFKEEWDSLIRSGLGVVAFEISLFCAKYFGLKIPIWPHTFIMLGLAFVWGYAGQRLAYKYLGTAESVLEKKADLLKDAG
jgi:hypothetical protein